jgi:hypothetical protein
MMPYTIWSRGQLVGETSLDHTRADPRQRSGDFLPTAFGETLIPPPEPAESLPADIQVTSSLFEELELRAPDGTPIPAEWIEIRDIANTRSVICPRPSTIENFSCARRTADPADVPDDFDLDDWDVPDEDLGFLEDLEFDLEEFDHWMESRVRTDFPRFEIDIRLVDENAVP